jgi:hypothetical protein
MISFKYSTRLVIILKNIVIKIPINRRGYLQGLNEKYIWDKYKDITSLAELKWMYLGIVCQKRYNADLSRIPKMVVKRIKAKVPEFNFTDCDLHNSENWGYEGKNYILLDYGINQEIANLYHEHI